MPASVTYDHAMDKLVGNAPAINFVTGSFKLMLVNGYAPNQATHTTRADVTNETVGTGYTAGGLAAAIATVLNTGTHTETINMANVNWPGLNSFSATGGVLYQSYGGAASGDPLVCYLDFGGTVTCSAGAFTVAQTGGLTILN